MTAVLTAFLWLVYAGLLTVFVVGVVLAGLIVRERIRFASRRMWIELDQLQRARRVTSTTAPRRIGDGR